MSLFEVDSFFVNVEDEDSYMVEEGRYHIISDEHDVNIRFNTKGELIGWISEHLVDINK